MTTTATRPRTVPLLCSFALGRGLYCGLPDQHEGTHVPHRRCVSQHHWHPAHTWVYGGQTVQCDGQPEARTRDEGERGQCCSDPLCPCAYKPGWSPYAAPTVRYADL